MCCLPLPLYTALLAYIHSAFWLCNVNAVRTAGPTAIPSRMPSLFRARKNVNVKIIMALAAAAWHAFLFRNA